MPPSVLTRIVDGEGDALRACIARYGGLVWHIARRMTRTPADAEDATQDIFLDIWRNAGRFDASRGSETVFIATIARPRLIDRLRKKRTEPAMDSLQDLDRDSRVDPGHPERCVEADRAAVLLAALQAPQRQVLELSLLHGLSHSAIAARLKLPLGTVKSCMRRGLLRLREVLDAGSRPRRPEGSCPARSGVLTNFLLL